MSTETPDAEKSIDDLDDRDVRALTERMTVVPDVGQARGAEDLFVVVSHTGEQYLIDTRLDSCECPDYEYRSPDEGCKHLRRARYVRGERRVPTWVDPTEIDECIGAAVDGTHVAADGGSCEDCAELPDDFPCAECYVTGKKKLPDE